MYEVIKADEGYDELPIYNFNQEGASADGISFVQVDWDWSGTSANKATIWAGCGSIKTYKDGDSHYMDLVRAAASTPSTTAQVYISFADVNKLWMCSYVTSSQQENQRYLLILALTAETEEDARNMVRNNNWTDNTALLYRRLYSESGDVIGEERDWDDSPTTDTDNPFNDTPIGGAFAQTDRFDNTDMQYLSDLPEPENINYGSFLTAYSLDNSNMGTLGESLFATGFWQSLKNKFEGLSDPMSFIVAAVELPFRLGATPTTFKLGGIAVTDSNDNPISCLKHVDRYLKYDFGGITLKEVWGTAKDYTDCDISIFLPYVGMRKIDPDLGVNSKLSLSMIVDVWTGDLNYMLEVNNSNMDYKYYSSSGVPYRWSGNCGNKIPIGKVDPSSPILNVAASLGSMAMGVGMMMVGGPAAAGAGAAAIGGAAATGAGASELIGGAKSLFHDFSNGFTPLAQSSGNISGAIGYLDYQYPYLVIKRGVPKYPNNWRAEIGAPRYQEFTVGSLHGFTEFAGIHADNVSGASDDEKHMIEKILMDGIII